MEQVHYKYSPLKSGGREIRLAILEPSEDKTSDIRVNLIHISLGTLLATTRTPAGIHFSWAEDDPPPLYSALSYCWGNTNDTRTILLNGIKTMITSNLYSALQELRLSSTNRRLWIDALCINQDDTSEKSVQISLMRDIYWMAQEVIIWLGDAGPNTGLAINFLSEHIVLDCGLINDSDMLESLQLEDASLAFTILGSDLLKRSWWFRTWIWQEIACARRATVKCGIFEIQWDKLILALVFAERNGIPTNQMSSADLEQGAFYAPYKDMHTHRRNRFSGNPIRLLEMLCTSWRSGATDPRDKVFALLGLTTDSQSPLLSPDYTKSWAQVYKDAVRFFVERDHSLDVLCASVHSHPHSQLPSWVPDWNDSSQGSNVLAPIAMDDKSYGRYYFTASRDSTADAEFLGEGDHLRVSGFGSDTVERIGEVLINQMEMITILKSWQVTALGEQHQDAKAPYVAGGNKYDAFHRTICVDRDFYGFKPPAGARGLDFDPYLIPDSFLPHLPEYAREQKAFVQQLGAIGHNAPRRRFFVTRDGYMGLGPAKMQEGDLVTILKGCSVPALLREDGEGKYHHFVGEVYVCGIMDGEMMEEIGNGRSSWQSFVLQ